MAKFFIIDGEAGLIDAILDHVEASDAGGSRVFAYGETTDDIAAQLKSFVAQIPDVTDDGEGDGWVDSDPSNEGVEADGDGEGDDDDAALGEDSDD